MPEQEIQEQKPGKPKNVPLCCVGCVRWERFGKSCFYYWELKKHCTMWASAWDEVPVQ